LATEGLKGQVERLRSRLRGSAHGRVAVSVVTIAVVAVLVKLVAMLREVLVARAFGVSDEVDAFVTAFVPIALAVNLVGSFTAALIPTYVRVLARDGETEANALIRGVTAPIAAILLATTAVLAFIGPTVLTFIAPGFPAWKHVLALRLYYEMLPVIALSALCALWGAVLNARHRFVLAAAAPVLVTVAVVIAIVATEAHANVEAIAIGTTLGTVLQAGLLAMAVARQGVPVLPSRWRLTPNVREVLGQWGPLVAAALLLSSNAIVDQVMASMLPAGSVSALSYGNRIASQLTSLVALAVGTAVLPAFAALVAAERWDEIRRALRLYGAAILAVTVPLTIVLAWRSHDLVSLLYRRGAFSAEDTVLVARVQAMFVIQVPFYTTGILFVKLISALGKNRIFFWANILNVSLNATLDYVLMRRMGVAGIALSSSVVYVVSCLVLGLVSLRLIPREVATPSPSA
jgi:putative peptidoglycan lipid II flippase